MLRHMSRAIPSTYYQLICFSTPEGVGEIIGDQVAAKQCFLTACATKVKAGKVPMMELHEDMPTTDDVEQLSGNKVMEDLKKIYID